MQIIRPFLAVCLMILSNLAPISARAQTQQPPDPAILYADQLQTDLSGHLQYLLDADWQLTPEDMERPETAGRFAPVEGTGVDFGYTKSAIWLRFAITNDGLEENQWRLHLRENFLQVFNVYERREDGGYTALALQDPNSAFSTRPTSHPELVVPFELADGQTKLIYVQYWSGGSSDLDFNVLSAEELEAVFSQLSAKNFIYYGMMVILTILSLMALVVTRNFVFLAYAAYSFTALLFIVHADGNGFKYLWPNAPAFNGYATIAIGAALVMSGAFYSKAFLQTARYHKVMNWLLNGVIAIVTLTLLASIFADHQQIKKLLVLIAMGSVLVFAAAGLNAARTRFKEVRFYVLAWIGAFISASIMTSRHWLGVGIPESLQFDSIRIVMVSDATLMGLAIWDRINQLRQSNQASLRASLEQAQRNLQLSERMQELEQQYRTALENTERKDEQLANTLHDLRQPLFALRANVHYLAHGKGTPPQNASDIETSFAYLEGLVAHHLERTKTDEDQTSAVTESTDIETVFSAVQDMFAVEASAKGLKLAHVKTSATTWINQLDLMRLVSNLVSNAIKFTETGRVLFGCRRHKGGWRIEVHDTGPGLSAEEFEKACARNERLNMESETKPGFGYGLAIVSEIAETKGLNLHILPRRPSGTSIAIDLPAERPPAQSDLVEVENHTSK